MNTTNNNVQDVIALVEGTFNVNKTEVVDQYQVAFEVEKNDVHGLLSILKSKGWIQLSYLSAVDWIDENQFELVYIVFNWDKPVYVQVRTRLNRDNPVMSTIMPIYEGCKYYEREACEFFGIKFPGNPDYDKQLILEEWDDMPPLRKDFDPQAYSDKKFPVREYSETHVLVKGESQQEKRENRKIRIDAVKGGKK
jgi:NADH-quinone oxidoreductase subunit C